MSLSQYVPDKSREYVQMFFMPLPRASGEVFPNLRYTLGTPLKRPQMPEDLVRKSTLVSFEEMSPSMPHSPNVVFKKEQAILSNFNHSGQKFLVPNVDLIKLSMEEVFNRPRNRFLEDSMPRDFVGGYIYEKLGRAGLLVTIQDFKHVIPIKAYSEFIGQPINVSTNCKKNNATA